MTKERHQILRREIETKMETGDINDSWRGGTRDKILQTYYIRDQERQINDSRRKSEDINS